MSTTSLFVEILIIGLEAFVWLALILGTLWKPGPFFDILKQYKEYAALMTMLLLALAYVLGIIIDRLADSFYKLFRYASDKPLPAPVAKMRLRIMHDSEGMAKFLDYQRSRLRIARATVFNLLVTIVATSIWLIHSNIADALVLGSVIGIGLIVLVLSISAVRRIDEAQLKRLVEAYGIITEHKGDQNMTQRVMAAVCYKHINDRVEFLLVRTKGGKYWTFPKGHIKKDLAEAPWQAARREAGEEAGVDGTIEKEPFTNYAYSKGEDMPEDVVGAFLMHVESERVPEEPERDPTWLAPEKAIKKLSKGRREKRFALEHQRVIEEALVRIERMVAG